MKEFLIGHPRKKEIVTIKNKIYSLKKNILIYPQLTDTLLLCLLFNSEVKFKQICVNKDTPITRRWFTGNLRLFIFSFPVT